MGCLVEGKRQTQEVDQEGPLFAISFYAKKKKKSKYRCELIFDDRKLSDDWEPQRNLISFLAVCQFLMLRILVYIRGIHGTILL